MEAVTNRIQELQAEVEAFLRDFPEWALDQMLSDHQDPRMGSYLAQGCYEVRVSRADREGLFGEYTDDDTEPCSWVKVGSLTCQQVSIDDETGDLVLIIEFKREW